MCRTLVESIQSRLTAIASSTSITQTTSILTPHRGSLQASVTLHTMITLHEGLVDNNLESMREYIRMVLESIDYQRILPQSVLNALEEVDEMMKIILKEEEEEEEMIIDNEKEENKIHHPKELINENKGDLYQEDTWQVAKEWNEQRAKHPISSSFQATIHSSPSPSSLPSQIDQDSPHWRDNRDEDFHIAETEFDKVNPVLEEPLLLIEESLLQTMPSLIRYYSFKTII